MLLIGGALLLLAGLLMFSTGLLSEILIRAYFESQGRQIYAVQQILSRSERALAGTSTPITTRSETATARSRNPSNFG
jgi:hypothetical protein